MYSGGKKNVLEIISRNSIKEDHKRVSGSKFERATSIREPFRN
jgi:hypothetical protein